MTSRPDGVAKKVAYDTMNTKPSSTKETTPDTKRDRLTPETIQGLQELGAVFRQIHNRLISEGCVIKDGKIIRPGANETNHGGAKQK